MNKLEINLNSPSFSINSAYYRNRKRTTECRKWGKKIHDQLEKYRKDFDLFRSKFDPIKHAIQVTLDFYVPIERFYTKDNKVSRRSKDLSNIEKLLLDLIFDKRYYERDLPSLNIDDTLITILLSRKRPTLGKDRIEVVIEKISNKIAPS